MIRSGNDFDDTKKVSHFSLTYAPCDMSDASVFELAKHYFTLEEISEFFNTSIKTIKKLHNDAFLAGKRAALQKPRMLLAKVFDDYSDPELNFANPETSTNTLLKAIDMHHRMYVERYADKPAQTPSATDIKLVPFEVDADE